MSNDITTYEFSPGNLIKSSEVNTNNDDITNNAIIPLGVAQAQNYFETLKQSGTIDNTDYMIADIFTDADGLKNTIVTGDSSATYDATNDYYIMSASNSLGTSGTINDSGDMSVSSGTSSNAFDDNSSTYYQRQDTNTEGPHNSYLGKTFLSKYVGGIRVKANASWSFMSSGTKTAQVILESYNGSIWTEVANLATNTSANNSDGITYDDVYFLNDTVSGYRVRLYTTNINQNASGYITHTFYLVGEASFISSDVETTTLLTLDGTEKGLIVYDKSNKPTGTSINVDVSDGSTTLSTKALRSYIDISSLSSGNLSLDFNLATTDTSVTPSLYGYGLVIIK